VYDTINESLLLVGIAKIEDEICAPLRAQAASSRQADAFPPDHAELGRMSAGPQVIRITGKVECSRIGLQNDDLGELLEQLAAYQKTIADTLRALKQKIQEIARSARCLWTAAS
jgi:hypothetical protein